MDDIAACIKDHQYNEAIRKTVVDPEDALAKAILEKIPTPPKAEIKPVEDFLATVTLDVMVATALGRFFLFECAKVDGSPVEERKSEKLQLWLTKRCELLDGAAPTMSDLRYLEVKLSKIKLGGIIAGFDEALEVCKARIAAVDISDLESSGSVAKAFDPILDLLKDKLLSDAFEEFKKHETFPRRYLDVSWYRDREPSMDDFVVFRDLGRGAFGVVSGARHRCTGQMVALKGMNRKLIKGKKVLKMVKVEFEVLKTLGEKPSPFCVSLRYSFMDATDLYLGLPLCTGGDLMFHLRYNRKGYGVERARFFAAEILLAIEHLHSLGILYRDLKPENVLLDDTGHTKISDMGLAVLTGYTPRTIGNKTLTGRAGTPGYWPPEMIKKEGYGFDADWWSYGVMVFEFLTGSCAFSESLTKCRDRNEATLTWELQFPSTSGENDPFPEEAKSLIHILLNRDRSTRLGAKPEAVEELKKHAFFSTIDWGKLAAGTVSVPWVPSGDTINAASQEELQERSKEHEFKKLKLTPEDDIQGIAYSSRHHEEDLVEVLRLEKQGKLQHLESRGGSSACSIL